MSPPTGARSAAIAGPSPETRRLPDRRGHGPRRSRAAGRRRRKPARDSSRRCASAEDQHCVWLSSRLAAGLEHAPTGHGQLNGLLASVAVPTTRCVNRQRCAGESRHDFRRACRVTSSDRRPARKGKAPTELPLQIEAVPALPTVPTGPTPTSGSAGTSSRSPHQRRSNERFCWSR